MLTEDISYHSKHILFIISIRNHIRKSVLPYIAKGNSHSLFDVSGHMRIFMLGCIYTHEQWKRITQMYINISIKY